MDGAYCHHYPSVSLIQSIQGNCANDSKPRSFKQVKNWFSNERQKNRSGEMISVYSEEGDKMRLRASAFKFSQHWSDSLLEEVAMVYHFLVTQTFRRRKRRLAVQKEPPRIMEINGQNSHSLL